MPIYDGECQECKAEQELFIPSAEVDLLHPCESCGKVGVKRVWKNMPGTTRASFIDSSKTARASEFKDLRQAAKLEVDKANMKPKDRAEISKEIKRLQKIKK
jgi:putative FmdB family regulatory protein